MPIKLQSPLCHGVKLEHHDETNVLIEFTTNQHFGSPEGGELAIINSLFAHMQKYDGLTVMWETEGTSPLQIDQCEIVGAKVAKTDARLHKVMGKKAMLSCGGFEGNREMLIKYVGPCAPPTSSRLHPASSTTGAMGSTRLWLSAPTPLEFSFEGMQCEPVDTRATKPDAVIWNQN